MLSKTDYRKLGFKCGLEVHQRLATQAKLFCSCDAQLPNDVSVAEVERRQRAVAGELGSIDPSAIFETSKGRKFVYNAFAKTTCLVDLDEEPPHELNRDALGIAMQISASLNASTPDELEVMRKEVVDGSDPGGFQRTVMVGYEGSTEIDGREIGIPSIFLEEESAGIEYNDKNVAIYNLDRFGVPLVEIDTAPDLKTPDEAKAAAERIGLILRLTGRVQRGIGSIRQDVNVSIREGARVEIKGFQDLDTMDTVIANEVERQQHLVEIRDELRRRKAKVHPACTEVTSVFGETKAHIVAKSIGGNGSVMATKLSGFAGMLGREINQGRRLGSEISDYAKLAGLGGIIHSDENLEGYGFSEREISTLRNLLDVGSGDAFILVTGDKETCVRALSAASIRAQQAIEGVPKETRGVDQKLLVTTFLRPLPGGERMYPETDVKPVAVDADMIAQAKDKAASVEFVEKRLREAIGNRQLEERMLWSQHLNQFFEILEKTGAEGSVVAATLLEKMTQLRRSGVNTGSIGEDALLKIFEEYGKGTITKGAIEEILKQAPRNAADVENAIKEGKLKRLKGKLLEQAIKEAGREGSREERIRRIMSRHRLTIDGEELRAILK